MRVVHHSPKTDTLHVQVRCGRWGPRDTDWTEDAAGVTCPACRSAMGQPAMEPAPSRARAPARAPVRPAAAWQRLAAGWQRLALSFRRAGAAGRP